jgi:hypothetical protein
MEPTPSAARAHHPPGRSDWTSRLPLGRRQIGIVIGLFVGAAVMLVVAALTDVAGTTVPVLSTLASAPIPAEDRPLAVRTPPPATPGTCLSWRRSDAADAVLVDCARQHLFEQAGPVELTEYGPDSPLPTNQRFRELVNERCTPLVVRYLDGHYDPSGAFRAGALKPSTKSWASGDRTLRCGLQRFSRSGALYPIAGKVTNQDQADIRPAGTCLGIDGKFVGDPVSCALPHAEESVGSVDLGQKFGDKFPAASDQDNYLQPTCSKLAADYAGGPNVVSDKKLVVIWTNLSQQSWAAGTRKVACNLAAVLPDKSGYAPVTGSVKGPVQVGDKPAEPAEQQVPAGAPAPGAGTDSDGRTDHDDESPPPSSAPAQPSLAPGVPLPANPLPANPAGDRGGGNGGRLTNPLGGQPPQLPTPPVPSAKPGG